MVGRAESILQDCRHGFERVDDGGSVGIAGIRCIVGECARGVFSDVHPRGADTRLKSTTVLKQCRHPTTLQSLKFYKFYRGMVKVKANMPYRTSVMKYLAWGKWLEITKQDRKV